jgi:hypothetical protein
MDVGSREHTIRSAATAVESIVRLNVGVPPGRPPFGAIVIVRVHWYAMILNGTKDASVELTYV